MYVATQNLKSDLFEKMLKHVLCGAQFVPILLLCKITLILCKGHITCIQLFDTVVHRSISRNTCTYVHVIHICLPTFQNRINMINASFPNVLEK